MAENNNTTEKKVTRQRRPRRTALRPMEFLFSQIYDTNANTVLGYDAVLYINDKKRGTLSYDNISGICDRNNLSARVGKWQITETCEMLTRKDAAGKHVRRVFITLSSRYVGKPKFVEEFDRILGKYQIEHNRFCIQVREPELNFATPELFSNFDLLRERGTKIAITEFGVESSSMLKLTNLHVDYIKLDPAFAEDIDVNERTAGVTESAIELADKLGYLVIADGVDTREQLRAMNKLRCFLIEGRHFSVPEREDEAIH